MKLTGLMMIAIGVISIWLPLEHWISAGIAIFAGMLLLMISSKRVHIDPPEKRRQLKK